MKHQPIAYDAKNAAKALNLTTEEFLNLVQVGALPPGHDLGNKTRWAVADLEAIFSGARIDESFEP